MSSDEESDFSSNSILPRLTSLVAAVDIAIQELRDLETSLQDLESASLYTRKRHLRAPIHGLPSHTSLKELVHHFLPSWTLSVAGRHVTVPDDHQTLLGLKSAYVDVYTILVALDGLLEK